MNLRKTTFILAAAAAMIGAASSAQARGTRPGHYAYGLLQYGSGWRLYDAGCLTWDYRTQSWYTLCGLPQNAPFYPAPIAVKY